MNSSFLYHAFGVKEYHYSAIDYKDSAIYLKVKSNSPKKCKCPHCGCEHVIKYGTIHRNIHNLPIGSKPTFLSLTIQRYQCKSCEKVFQAGVPFTHGSVSYTFRFSRYVLALLRLGLTVKSVARHLGVGWDLIKDIHKKHLKQKYSYVDIKKVKRIGIDEFAVRKGHVYKTIVVDLRVASSMSATVREPRLSTDSGSG